MKIKHEEVVEMLSAVKLRGSQYNFHRLLNTEEKNAIASVLTEGFNSWLHIALTQGPKST